MASDSGSFATPCVPKFDGDYENWSLFMENLLHYKEYWSAIQSGFEEPKGNEALSAAQQKDTANQLWDLMKLKYQGNARVKRAQLQRLRRTFETLEMKAGEGVSEYFTRVMSIAIDMRKYFEASLLVHEQEVIDKRSEEQVLQVENIPRYGQGRDRGTFQRGRGLEKEAVNYVEFDEEEELLLMAYTKKSKVEREGIWFLDSGCLNHHMTGNKTWFVELDESFKHTVTNVYYVPNLTNNLLSIGQLHRRA
ncbi:uncharacterized protein LOC111437850 [Cucurbita moschata]|uniref:Uncharacterized protein LOC111437850 n=1 Tax=Cucurbita moschata TaxID=3662 RepID=A0A6J1EUC8_CUCMO|nr:uncharacterized protein LOC111437850 [Cucurbita moschata]